MDNIFDIDKFNIIDDDDNYYFFRALNLADNEDIENNITCDSNGEIQRIRTDRERYGENAKYNKNSPINLEQVFDHIKMHYRKDTNFISLSSNANVSALYGRGNYKDRYVIVKVPKKEMGEKVINAGQYMLGEIQREIDKYIKTIKDERILKLYEDIDKSTSTEEIKRAIQQRYKSEGKLEEKQHKMRKGIKYSSPTARISSYQALDEGQILEKNKIIAKLTLLERKAQMPPLLPHTSNNNILTQTIGNAFASMELLHYGDILKGEILDIPKEIVDIFSLIQQEEGEENKSVVQDLKKDVIKAIENKVQIPSLQDRSDKVRENIDIDEMYELTNGRVEYGKANSIVKNMFYLSKGQADARKIIEILKKITNDNPKYKELIEDMSKKTFRIEPEISIRQSNKGQKISESVSLDLRENEKGLIDRIEELSDEEQEEIIRNGGLSNVRNIMNDTFAEEKRDFPISKNEYYAETIFSLYDWKKIGIEEFTVEERNNLIQRIQNEYCVELYQKLEEQGIDRNDIPTILLNMVTIRNDFEITEKDTAETIRANRLDQYDKIIAKNIGILKQEKANGIISNLNQDLSIERIERFLGYYDVKGTGIQLRPYQQTADEKTDEIFESERFASVILPTGGGKSFVAISQLLKHKDEEILYLAPQNEILEQMKDYIIKNVHGPVNTTRKK